MRARWTGRLPVVSLAVLALLVTGGLGGTPASSALAATASASTRIESAWTTSVGTRGANGSATVRAFDTARGSVILSLRRLTPSARYAVVIRRGACGSLGTQVAAVGTFTATRSGALSATVPLTVAQVAAVRDAAVGRSRVSLVAGSGSRTRCGTLVKSLAVTPQVWFGPLSTAVPGWPVGRATDHASLFTANSPWSRVAGRTQVFVFQTHSVDQHTGTAELRRMIDALKARQIRIAIEWYALRPEGCGYGFDGFGGGADWLLPVLRRIRSLGGTVSYVSVTEPFSGGVFDDGPYACHWSVRTVAEKVAAQVKRVHAEFPAIEIGLIEGYNGPPWIGYAKQWIAAYEAATGERLPFYHGDFGFDLPGWTDGAARIQAYVRSRGTRFGLFYTSWPPAKTDAEWFAGATANMNAFELEGAGPPDDAIFEVWTDHPDTILPETGATTMTRLVADYIRTRTAATVTGTLATSGGTIAVTGSVRTLGGDPVGGGRITVKTFPRDGPYEVLQFTGTAPAGASEAVIQVHNYTNPGSADLALYEVGYTEGTSTTNLVPTARFQWGWSASDPASVSVMPSDRGAGNMLRVVPTPGQTFFSNSDPFTVRPGAGYRFWVAARIPEASAGNVRIALAFLDADQPEIGRDDHPLAPAPVALGTATTNATGGFSLATSPLEAGRNSLLAEYPGNATYWPARARAEVTVP